MGQELNLKTYLKGILVVSSVRSGKAGVVEQNQPDVGGGALTSSILSTVTSAAQSSSLALPGSPSCQPCKWPIEHQMHSGVLKALAA